MLHCPHLMFIFDRLFSRFTVFSNVEDIYAFIHLSVWHFAEFFESSARLKGFSDFLNTKSIKLPFRQLYLRAVDICLLRLTNTQ